MKADPVRELTSAAIVAGVGAIFGATACTGIQSALASPGDPPCGGGAVAANMLCGAFLMLTAWWVARAALNNRGRRF